MRLVQLCSCSLLCVLPVFAQAPDTLIPRQAVVLEMPRGYADVVVAPNPVEAAIALGTWDTPSAGDAVVFPGGSKGSWRSITADSSGWFTDSAMNGCYCSVRVPAARDRIMLLEGFGDEFVYVNGIPRTGNPYGLKDSYEWWEPRFDYSRLPVDLRQGSNEFLFRCSRGGLKVRLCSPPKPVMLNSRDLTLPDACTGMPINAMGAIVIINASHEPLRGCSITTSAGSLEAAGESVPLIQPMSVRKVAFRITGPAQPRNGVIPVLLLLRAQGGVMDTVTIQLRVVDWHENHKETFVSAIDGSVQYYGILPATDTLPGSRALVLSLHGASVEAINQTGSYEAKSWGHIVAPTNRRPYGFNWEEWGRMDALEVLNLVKSRYLIDDSRVYLTGHSMGGHGVWHLGTLYPDQFAAIGPSAGWISFWTYRFRGMNLKDSSGVRAMIRRATGPSETFNHIDNLRGLGVYVLHGAADDNVPVTEARSMVERLTKEHSDFVYHEQPGAGHWWDASDEPGTDCVDWAPMFDFFARHVRPTTEQMREISFETTNPGVSSTYGWLNIDAQEHPLQMSRASLRYDPGMRRISGTTANIARLRLAVPAMPDTLTATIDSQSVTIPNPAGPVWLTHHAGRWTAGSSGPAPGVKSSGRYGCFKEAFRNRMVLVYGTHGNAAENRWAFDKARFDAEKLWYQGNGSVDVCADHEFDAVKLDPDRNVILYGNRSTNAAWKTLLAGSPVQVDRGSVTVGDRTFRGNDLSCIFIRPRTGSATASIGAVAGSGITGMRVVNRIPYLNPGIGLPDWTLLNSRVLTEGDEGILGTGWFDLNWTLDHGEFLWNSH